jgi:hypothetical protein
MTVYVIADIKVTDDGPQLIQRNRPDLLGPLRASSTRRDDQDARPSEDPGEGTRSIARPAPVFG